AHARAADLGEASVGEDLDGADMQLAPGDLPARPGAHGVALKGVRAALPRVADRRGGQGVADAALAVPLADDEAGHGPDPLVLLILARAAFPYRWQPEQAR